ncbi:MAG: hypothetical protein V4660_18620 [Pseudomonadota bacterium]
MEYFPVKITLNYKSCYLIWCSDSVDKVLSINGKTPKFDGFENLLKFSSLNEIELTNEVAHYNLDKIKLWCNSPTTQIEAKSFLNAWNLFGDLAAAYPESRLKYESLTQKCIRQYNKLFYGSNLPCIKTTSRKFCPEWSPRELVNIRTVFLYGFEICRSKLRNNYV